MGIYSIFEKSVAKALLQPEAIPILTAIKPNHG